MANNWPYYMEFLQQNCKQFVAAGVTLSLGCTTLYAAIVAGAGAATVEVAIATGMVTLGSILLGVSVSPVVGMLFCTAVALTLGAFVGVAALGIACLSLALLDTCVQLAGLEFPIADVMDGLGVCIGHLRDYQAHPARITHADVHYANV